jgi:hypothetical protein
VTVDDLLEVVGMRKTNPEHDEEWYKKADWWKKAVADFDRREAKTHAERVGETMSSREGKAEAARAPPGSRRSRSQQDCRSRDGGSGRERRGNNEYKSMFWENLC